MSEDVDVDHLMFLQGSMNDLVAENARLRDMVRDAMAAMLLVRRCGNGGAKLSREASDAIRSWLATHASTTQ
jgi:pyruvate/2-oxoglutarate/acetoin dehydrogenase E1 component